MGQIWIICRFQGRDKSVYRVEKWDKGQDEDAGAKNHSKLLGLESSSFQM